MSDKPTEKGKAVKSTTLNRWVGDGEPPGVWFTMQTVHDMSQTGGEPVERIYEHLALFTLKRLNGRGSFKTREYEGQGGQRFHYFGHVFRMKKEKGELFDPDKMVCLIDAMILDEQ